MIGFIGAMQVETEGIIAMMTDTKAETYAGITYTTGKLSGKDIVVATCGVGKVNAAVCAQCMIFAYKPEVIINTGVAGSLSNALNIGDIALGCCSIQTDMDTSPVGDPLGLISGLNLIELPCDTATVEKLEKAAKSLGIQYQIGKISTGDQFVNSNERKKFIQDNFGCIACEMESGSIAHVCLMNDVKFAVIRSISDKADNSSHMDYGEFVKIAADNSIRMVKAFVEEV